MLKKRKGKREERCVGKRQLVKDTDLHELQIYPQAFRKAEGLSEKINVNQDRAYCNTTKPQEEEIEREKREGKIKGGKIGRKMGGRKTG